MAFLRWVSYAAPSGANAKDHGGDCRILSPAVEAKRSGGIPDRVLTIAAMLLEDFVSVSLASFGDEP